MNPLPIEYIEPGSPPRFPPADRALRVPNGLLAVGGDLSPERLLAAYANGIFPWFGEGEPILWWSPEPRCVFDTHAVHVSHSLRRQLRHSNWTLSLDRAFDAVIEACAAPRPDQAGTWIVPAMVAAYRRLHRMGNAHSMEVWDGARLVGGIYGVAVGRMFCGESMFSRESGGSKVALLGLCGHLHRHGFPLLDAQVVHPHLLSLGAREMPRKDFIRRLRVLAADHPASDPWRSNAAIAAASLLERPDA